MKNIVEGIREFNTNNFTMEELIGLFKIKKLPIIFHDVPINTPVFRCRKNNNYYELFYFEKEISYRTDIQNINFFGRANFPYSSKFYGSIPTEDIKDGDVISIFETSTNLRNNFDGIEFYTIGKWLTTNEIKVATVIPDITNNHLSKINEILTKVFNANKQHFSKDELEFHEIVGKEFSKLVEIGKEKEYAVSSSFSEQILRNPLVDGIIYPSVQSRYKGINIVLDPIKTDKFLKLEFVIFGALYKFGEFAFFNNLLMADLNEGYPFKWKVVKEKETLNNMQIINLLKRIILLKKKLLIK